MPRNGSGTYTLPEAAFTPGSTISSSAVNSDFSDIASALTNSIAADGQTPITGAFLQSNGTVALPSYAFSSNINDGFYHVGPGVIGVALQGVETFSFNAPSAAAGSGLLGVGNALIMPISTVLDYAGLTEPTGWFFCNGQAISRTTYSELFTVIGTTYGTGNGSTTFNVPDLRGRVVVGQDTMGISGANRVTTAGSGVDGTTIGASGGNQLSQAHTHTGTTGGQSQTHTHTASAGNGGTTPAYAGTGDTQAATGGGSSINPSAGVSIGNASQDHTHSFTTDSTGGGSSQNMPPSLIMNKIIFAGHA